MLSRHASELYWIARHIERAENTARLLDVTYRTSLLPYEPQEPGLAWAQPWDRNLIVNPGAEDGPGAAKRTDVISNVPGWTRTGAFSVGQYTGVMPLWVIATTVFAASSTEL